MAFEIRLSAKAQFDIDESALFIAEDSPTHAAKWKSTLEDLILSLADAPDRFDLIPESTKLKRAYRSVNHYSHRVIFRVDEQANVVYIVRIYHGARRALTKRSVE
jgi:plasmid stabilization system protein ParE